MVLEKYNITRRPGGYFTPLHLAELPGLGCVAIKQYGDFPDPNAVPSTGQYNPSLALKVLLDQEQLRAQLVQYRIRSQQTFFTGLFPIDYTLETAANKALVLCDEADNRMLHIESDSQAGYRIVVVEQYLGPCLRTLIRQTDLGEARGVEIIRQAVLVLKSIQNVPEQIGLDAKPDNFVVQGQEVFFIDHMPPKIDDEYSSDHELLALFPTNNPKGQYYQKKMEQYHLRAGRQERYLEYLFKYLKQAGLEHLYQEVLLQIQAES